MEKKHIALVSGSGRNASHSLRIAHWLASRLAHLDKGTTCDVIDLGGHKLPQWDEAAWDETSALAKQWKLYSARLAAAHGLVLITPEWAGMACPELKNFLVFCSEKDVGHKPALLVGVSSGRGGSNPISELRISGYKNNRICYMPEHLIVRDVENMFVEEKPSGREDAFTRSRADFALLQLLAYSSALKQARDSGALANDKFPFGM